MENESFPLTARVRFGSLSPPARVVEVGGVNCEKKKKNPVGGVELAVFIFSIIYRESRPSSPLKLRPAFECIYRAIPF